MVRYVKQDEADLGGRDEPDKSVCDGSEGATVDISLLIGSGGGWWAGSCNYSLLCYTSQNTLSRTVTLGHLIIGCSLVWAEQGSKDLTLRNTNIRP